MVGVFSKLKLLLEYLRNDFCIVHIGNLGDGIEYSQQQRENLGDLVCAHFIVSIIYWQFLII
jgi:hypothetical protein